jgi:hypothetical protein
MILEYSTNKRDLKQLSFSADLVVIGGGIAGTCCAITAAREGLKVILVHDRPVLGGNASSEVRLWILGATSHMGNNNRWAREGGLIDEILLDNLYKNPESNSLIFDTILLDKVLAESNIKLLLNTAVFEVAKKGGSINAVKAFCSQNSTLYNIEGAYFCDASGDGIVAFQAGAAFRMGAEAKEEFQEKFAPTDEYGELLGHSIYFYSKNIGKPVKYIAPDFALKDITKIPRFKSFNAKDYGPWLWWIEYGGRLDTIHDSEEIKWELWKIVYGVWDYIKNSGEFPEAENLTLEWVGQIPGKRESRRFEGDYMLIQQDIIEQREHYDAVSFGGWSIDLHPADGIFSEKPGCNQWHSKGIYQIPYRSLYSKNVDNLFLAGRIISASHVAFGSTRVMATCANSAQAVGMAAKICFENGLKTNELSGKERISYLQERLIYSGQYIPNVVVNDRENLMNQAKLTASSQLILSEIPPNGPLVDLIHSAAQMLPLGQGKIPKISFWAYAKNNTKFDIELRISSKKNNHTPDIILKNKQIELSKGYQHLILDFDEVLDSSTYVFICFLKNDNIRLQYSDYRSTGILTVFNKTNPAVSNYGKQSPKEDIGVEEFEFWTPQRRPLGHNIAMKIDGGINLFKVENLLNGIQRPTFQPNAWVSSAGDKSPSITINWDEKKIINKIDLYFDTDFDHPMEQVLLTHPERVIPFCIRNYKILNDNNQIIFEREGNYQTINRIKLSKSLVTQSLKFMFEHPDANIPAALFEIRCYA